MSDYINIAPELFQQVASENPGYELHTIRLLAVKSQGNKYSVPIEIELTPK
jgi:hypothetical protein